MEPSSSETRARPAPGPHDVLLENVQRTLNLLGAENPDTTIEVKITLLFQGALITGYLVPGNVWWRRTAEAIRSDSENPSSAALLPSVEAVELLYEQTNDQVAVEKLHMIRAEVRLPGSREAEPATLWRVDLEDVQGFSFGHEDPPA